MQSDAELARRLQAEEDRRDGDRRNVISHLAKPMSPVDPEWETLDPNPDLHSLFVEFNKTYFWGKLLMCEVKWSPRMTTCAGICRYSPRERYCSIGLSIPLLKLRPRKDMVETLLHEMIHAFLFVTANNRDRDGHGPEFHKHMYRINAATGASISVYHTFHDEVALYKQHWWRCSGSCTKRPPFYGFVKRAMNRAPGPSDTWWTRHAQSCGGTFVKVKEPEKPSKKGKSDEKTKTGQKAIEGQKDIRDVFKGKTGNSTKVTNNGRTKTDGALAKGLMDANEVRSKAVGSVWGDKAGGPSVTGGGTTRSGGGVGAQGGGGRGNIFGFGGTSFGTPSGGQTGLKTAGKTGTIVVKPGQKQPSDNSSSGTVVGAGQGTGQEAGRTVGTSGGHRLGSTHSGVTPGVSVQDMVRNKWAGTNKSTALEKQTNSKSKNKSIPSEKQINSKDTNDYIKKSSDAATAPCPVCRLHLSLEEMNGHLDKCLATDNKPKEKPIDCFDDGCDADLLAATIDLEESLGDDTAFVNSGCNISDSDDDEPLVKRPKSELHDRNSTRNDDDLFGDVTVQDDLDLLAALENEEDTNQLNCSMFTCPVCDKLLSHVDMNGHLDGCLS